MTQTTRINPTQQNHYYDLITDDILAPARLYWVERNGRMLRRAWEKMTATEKILQNEADRRAYELALFDPCGLEVR